MASSSRRYRGTEPRHHGSILQSRSTPLVRAFLPDYYTSLFDPNLSRPRGLGCSERMDVGFASDEFSSSRLGMSSPPRVARPTADVGYGDGGAGTELGSSMVPRARVFV